MDLCKMHSYNYSLDSVIMVVMQAVDFVSLETEKKEDPTKKEGVREGGGKRR